MTDQPNDGGPAFPVPPIYTPDGLVCEGCGEWFDDVLCGADAPGFPRRCPMCQPRRKNKNRKPRVGAGIACAMVGKGGERNER